MAKITRAALRRIIRESLYGDQMGGAPGEMQPTTGLKIMSYEWNDLYNDPDTMSMGGELEITFSISDQEPMTLDVNIVYYKIDVDDLCESIAYTIESQVGVTFSKEEVKSALISSNLLNSIMEELAESDRIYRSRASDLGYY